jgi:hypothetical protein
MEKKKLDENLKLFKLVKVKRAIRSPLVAEPICSALLEAQEARFLRRYPRKAGFFFGGFEKWDLQSKSDSSISKGSLPLSS